MVIHSLSTVDYLSLIYVCSGQKTIDTKSVDGGSIQILYFNKNTCVSFTAHGSIQMEGETAFPLVNWPFIVAQAENVTQS